MEERSDGVYVSVVHGSVVPVDTRKWRVIISSIILVAVSWAGKLCMQYLRWIRGPWVMTHAERIAVYQKQLTGSSQDSASVTRMCNILEGLK